MPDGEPSRAVQPLGGEMVSAPSLLFSPGKYRRAKHSKRSILAVAKAVVKVMQEELPAGSLERWPELIDAQLGELSAGRRQPAALRSARLVRVRDQPLVQGLLEPAPKRHVGHLAKHLRGRFLWPRGRERVQRRENAFI